MKILNSGKKAVSGPETAFLPELLYSIANRSFATFFVGLPCFCYGDLSAEADCFIKQRVTSDDIAPAVFLPTVRFADGTGMSDLIRDCMKGSPLSSEESVKVMPEHAEDNRLSRAFCGLLRPVGHCICEGQQLRERLTRFRFETAAGRRSLRLFAVKTAFWYKCS